MAADDILAQQARAERTTLRGMLSLLSAAKEAVTERIRALPFLSATAAALASVEAAIGDAGLRLQFGWARTLAAGAEQSMGLGVQLAEVGLPAAEQAVPFFLPRPLLEATNVYHATLIRGLTDELRTDITRVLQVGLLSGASKEELVRSVVATGLTPVSPFQSAEARAETIVTTELNRIANLGAWERGKDAAERLPGMTKTWVAARDERTRPDHAALAGKTLPVEELFNVGGHRALYPLDTRLPASQSVRCRCRLRFKAPSP